MLARGIEAKTATVRAVLDRYEAPSQVLTLHAPSEFSPDRASGHFEHHPIPTSCGEVVIDVWNAMAVWTSRGAGHLGRVPLLARVDPWKSRRVGGGVGVTTVQTLRVPFLENCSGPERRS